MKRPKRDDDAEEHSANIAYSVALLALAVVLIVIAILWWVSL